MLPQAPSGHSGRRAFGLTDIGQSSTGDQSQAAEPSDLDDDLVAVLVVPALVEESADEDESEEELPDVLEDAEVLAVSVLR